MASSIQIIDELEAYHDAIKQTCIVKFTAKWCGPCRQMAPAYEAAAAEHAGKALFLEIDVDQAEEISAYEKVKGIPLFLFYHDGSKISGLTLAGSRPSQLRENVVHFFEIIDPAKLEPQVTIVTDNFSHLSLVDSSDKDEDSSKLSGEPSEVSNGDSSEVSDEEPCEQVDPSFEPPEWELEPPEWDGTVV